MAALVAVSILAIPSACSSRSQLDVEGTWVPTGWLKGVPAGINTDTTATLSLNDGTYLAVDGCSELSGEYSTDGDRITFQSPGAIGGGGCPNDDDFPWYILLPTVTSAAMTEGSLSLLGVDGQEVIRLNEAN